MKWNLMEMMQNIRIKNFNALKLSKEVYAHIFKRSKDK